MFTFSKHVFLRVHHLCAKEVLGEKEFSLTLPKIPMVNELLRATEQIWQHPNVTDIRYHQYACCAACDNHAPAVSINIFGVTTIFHNSTVIPNKQCSKQCNHQPTWRQYSCDRTASRHRRTASPANITAVTTRKCIKRQATSETTTFSFFTSAIWQPQCRITRNLSSVQRHPGWISSRKATFNWLWRDAVSKSSESTTK